MLAQGLAPETWNFGALLRERLRGGVNRLLPTLRLPLGPLRKLKVTSWEGAQTCNLAVARARSRSHRRLRLRLYRLGTGGFRSGRATPACRVFAARTAASRPACCTCGIRRTTVRNCPSIGLVSTRSSTARGVRALRGLSLVGADEDVPPRKSRFGGAAMKPVQLPREPRVLVVALRRLGDVLLTTPLIRSVKRAFPQASIDALVFAGTEGILTGQSRSVQDPHFPAAPAHWRNSCAHCRGCSSATILRCRRRPATGRLCSLPSPGGKAPGRCKRTGSALPSSGLRSAALMSATAPSTVFSISFASPKCSAFHRMPRLCCPRADRVRRWRRRSLCRGACRADVYLQALDRRRLAQARRRSCASADCGPRCTGAATDRAISMRSGATATLCGWTANWNGRRCPR